MDGLLPCQPSNKHLHHGGAVHCYSGIAVANESHLPPGASSEGVGQGQFAMVLCIYANRPRNKLITKLYNCISILNPLNFYGPTSFTVYTARTSYPFPPLSFLHVFGWLLSTNVVYQQLFKSSLYFIVIIFSVF